MCVWNIDTHNNLYALWSNHALLYANAYKTHNLVADGLSQGMRHVCVHQPFSLFHMAKKKNIRISFENA